MPEVSHLLGMGFLKFKMRNKDSISRFRYVFPHAQAPFLKPKVTWILQTYVGVKSMCNSQLNQVSLGIEFYKFKCRIQHHSSWNEEPFTVRVASHTRHAASGRQGRQTLLSMITRVPQWRGPQPSLEDKGCSTRFHKV